jgi:hypothetical protein
MALAAAMTAACTTTPPAPQEPPPPPPPSYEQLMDNAAQEQKAGRQAQALEAWQAAAKQSPAAKDPWLRIAQTHFETANYGGTIAAAQEVLQRDSTDATANGLLAVSGLRVSSEALARMRRDSLSGSTRSEAESLAKTLRDLLGEPVLVPPPAAADSGPKRKPKAKPVATTPGAAAAKPQPSATSQVQQVQPVANTTAPAKPAATGSRDPFGALR